MPQLGRDLWWTIAVLALGGGFLAWTFARNLSAPLMVAAVLGGVVVGGGVPLFLVWRMDVSLDRRVAQFEAESARKKAEVAKRLSGLGVEGLKAIALDAIEHVPTDSPSAGPAPVPNSALHLLDLLSHGRPAHTMFVEAAGVEIDPGGVRAPTSAERRALLLASAPAQLVDRAVVFATTSDIHGSYLVFPDDSVWLVWNDELPEEAAARIADHVWAWLAEEIELDRA